MSRLIVKNLPKNTTENQLRELFGQKGTVTDCSLKFTKDGVFRRFAFIGFSSEQEAQAARKYFDRSYIRASKIMVDMALDLGNAKPRAWSKYTKAQEQAKKTQSGTTEKERKALSKKQKKEEKEAALLGDLHQDPEFQEYMAVYSSKKRTAWDNDDDGVGKSEAKMEDDDNDSDDDEDDDSGEKGEEEEAEDEAKEEEESDCGKDEGEQVTKKVSDLEFLKAKMTECPFLSSDEDDDDDDDEGASVSPKFPSPKKEEAKKSTEKEEESRPQEEKEKKVSQEKFCIKVKNLKANVKERAIRKFFKPLKVKIHLPKNKNKLSIGIAFVECFSQKDMEAALSKNRNFIGKQKVYVSRVAKETPAEKTSTSVKAKPWELKAQGEEEEESIAESGCLFVRNLSYVCTEEDLEALFSKYGPVTDLDLPVDPISKRIKGFAHVTFLFPEHAVKARLDLDHKGFKGRLLHILPGKEREEKYMSSEKSSYKKQKDEKTKALAKSSHNWNALFLSGDSVATAMAAKYQTDKSEILDDSGRGSLGVRMALGETQLVQETRQFLIDNGVALDSFSQADGERSKRVMIVKDLPAATEADSLREVFGKWGTLNRVVLPPHGSSAIVEFQEPSEARRAFSKLAYRRFKDRPLYLEWAPLAVFGKDGEETTTTVSDEEGEGGKEEEEEGHRKEKEGEAKKEEAVALKKEETVKEADSDSEEESEPNSTLYVKNINFDSTEDSLTQLFSKAGALQRVTIAKKKDMKNPGQLLSMGYGFVQYRKAAGASEALKTLQHHVLDGHRLELKISQREILQPKTGRKKQSSQQKGSTKILVRNIPFQSNRREITELFRVFGELKFVRVPKKASGPGIQGFAFVDFLTKEDAKRAFDALCHSTHLYGRRLVLEWANTVETVQELQSKTKRKFQGGGGPAKKLRKQALMEALQRD